MSFTIGVDIGASKIEAGIVNKGKVLKTIRIENRGVSVSKNLFSAIDPLVLSGEKISGIGIGVPGIFERKGRLQKSPNMKEAIGICFSELVHKKYRVKAMQENDANCFALAENKFGAGRKCRNFIVLTIGTGIGSGVVLDGKLCKGEGQASEIGHHSISFHGPKCSCGSEGCMESFVSGTAIKRIAESRMGKAMELGEIIRISKKNGGARDVLEELALYFGTALANISNIFNPEKIILYGGVMESGSKLVGMAESVMKKRVFVNPPKIEIGRIKYAGVLGAAMLVE